MKKKLIFMPLSLLSVLALLQFGCDSESDKSEEVCENFPTPAECSTTIEASACCSDESTCHYVFDGKEYAYTDEGKEELISVMCPDISNEQTAAIYKQMAAQTKRLISEARISAICQ